LVSIISKKNLNDTKQAGNQPEAFELFSNEENSDDTVVIF
jgi:hypothetical protein